MNGAREQRSGVEGGVLMSSGNGKDRTARIAFPAQFNHHFPVAVGNPNRDI